MGFIASLFVYNDEVNYSKGFFSFGLILDQIELMIIKSPSLQTNEIMSASIISNLYL
jgi:hypothetical protein